jgi:hypothetical protein
MKRIEFLELLSSLYGYKTIYDESGNEFVVFNHSNLDCVQSIKDKTEFEAIENHIHLLDNIKEDEFESLDTISKILVKSIIYNLKCWYPEKQFFVYVSIRLHDSMIIRFHQKWINEEPYFNTADFTSPIEKVFMLES